MWSAHDGHCFWCAEPFDYKFCTVDHVIPERLLKDPPELARVLAMYGLPPDFNLNDFGNWVPSHHKCNGTKASLVFDATPAFLMTLERLKRKAPQARAFHDKFNSDRAVNSILAALEVRLERKQVPLDRVQELIRVTLSAWEAESLVLDRVEAGAESDTGPVLLVDGWAVHQRTGDIAHVVRDGRFGYTYVGNGSGSGFICPHCGRLGPWNGARCLTCGMLSDPED